MRQDNKGGLAFAAAVAGGVWLTRTLWQRLHPTDLTGQTVLVTGGSRGLGLLLAREFGRLGCRVAICARDEDELEQARAELAQHGVDVDPLPCDVSNRKQVSRMFQALTQRFGHLDILVNNAGQIMVGPLEATRLRDFKEAMAISYWGTVYTTLEALPQMQARGYGRIVNITSIGGKISAPHLMPYTSAKFAAVGFSQGLRAEVAKDGITVTTIVPGLMRTGSHLSALFKGDHEPEFTWFSILANLPFLSMDAERAARQILGATQRGEAERILSLPAVGLVKLNGLFPGLTTFALDIINRLLPSAPAEKTEAEPGREVEPRIELPLYGTLTALGQSAARRFQPPLDLDDDDDADEPIELPMNGKHSRL